MITELCYLWTDPFSGPFFYATLVEIYFATYNPIVNCIIKGKKLDWEGLPQTKSLFHAQPNCGLPIGNLTSQLFGNIYMNEFDHWVKRELNIKHYGRYVDDFVLIHESKDYLQSVIPKLSDFLLSTLQLTLHPDKIYLQHYSRDCREMLIFA